MKLAHIPEGHDFRTRLTKKLGTVIEHATQQQGIWVVLHDGTMLGKQRRLAPEIEVDEVAR